MSPNKHLTQIRPKNGTGPQYSPQRDLAWIYAPAMREAVRALDQVNWSDDIQRICKQCNVTEEDITLAVGKLTEAHRYMVNHPDVEQPVDALDKVGWYNVHPVARYLIYGRLGEVMLGGFFLALRDTSEFAKEAAQAKEIADFIAAGQMVMQRGSGMTATPTEAAQMQEQLIQIVVELRGCRDALNTAKNWNEGLERQIRDEKKLFNQVNHNLDLRSRSLEVASTMSFWRSLWFAVQSPERRQQWLEQQGLSPVSETENASS
jgi:hypothetical protein